MISSKAPSPSWLGKATTGQAHEYESALSPLYLWNLLQIGIGGLRDKHMSMTLSFETFSNYETSFKSGSLSTSLGLSKRELQGKHSCLALDLKIFLWNLLRFEIALDQPWSQPEGGLQDRRTSLTLSLKSLLPVEKLRIPMNLASATRCRSQGDESALNLLQNGICVDELPISSLSERIWSLPLMSLANATRCGPRGDCLKSIYDLA